MIKRTLPFLLIGLLAGCATLNIREQENNITGIITLINKGESGKLAASSTLPFLYDGEILIAGEDVALLWESLKTAGFTIKGGSVKSVAYVDKDDYTLFASTMEVKTFFRKYIPLKSVLVTVTSDNGTYYFITGKKIKGVSQIIAMKGPVL